MADPYRWGDVPPPAALRIRSRREFRASSLYARVKRGRIERAEVEAEANPLSRAAVRFIDRRDGAQAPTGSATPDPLGSPRTGSGESQRGTQARDSPGS